MKSFIRDAVDEIRETVATSASSSAFSGAVDSRSRRSWLHRAIGKQLTCVFVDNGLLNWGRGEGPASVARHLQMNVRFAGRERRSWTVSRCHGSERKRKIIGGIFIEVFEKEAKKV